MPVIFSRSFLAAVVACLALPLFFAFGGCDSTSSIDPEDAGASPEPEVTGQYQGPCHPDGTCDFGLDCVSEICVNLNQQPEPAPGEPAPAEPGVDAGTDPEPACEDRDQDGAGAMSCGGDDCDDDDADRAPNNTEKCSFVDENCDNVNNEGLDCTFTAHGPSQLYRVNPFVPTIEASGTANIPQNEGGILDIDIDPAGNTLAVRGLGLFDLAPNGNLSLVSAVATPDRTNGMAISAEGTIYITNADRVGGSFAYTVDRGTGVLTELGNLAPYESSGDCVILKDGSLLMSAPDPADPDGDLENGGDVLVRVDRNSGTTSLIGPLGYHNVYALSASFGFLFGMSDGGELFRIDPVTGDTELLLATPDDRYWGAANGD